MDVLAAMCRRVRGVARYSPMQIVFYLRSDKCVIRDVTMSDPDACYRLNACMLLECHVTEDERSASVTCML